MFCVMAVATVGGATAAVGDDSTCPDGHACFWTSGDFGGSKRVVGADHGGTGWHNFVNDHNSVKNRYSNRHVVVSSQAGGTPPVTCVAPGQNIKTIRIRSFRVTEAGAPCQAPAPSPPAPPPGGPPAKPDRQRSWDFLRKRGPKKSQRAVIDDDDGERIGSIRIVDVYSHATKQTWRNRRGKRKRVYRVAASFSVQFNRNNDFQADWVKCKQSVKPGHAVVNRDNERQMFPAAVTHLTPVQSSGEISAFLKETLTVTLPLGPFTAYVPDSIEPSVSWVAPSNSRHVWTWHIDDDLEPQRALFTFIGHWQGPARGLDAALRCSVAAIDRKPIIGDEERRRSVKLGLHVRP